MEQLIMPLVSVIIPTYNRAALIRRSVESIINQDFRDVEIIIIDDASDDGTEEIVVHLQQLNPSFEIHYHRLEERSGAQAARNRGINISRGTWIAFLDSDDEWISGFLSTMVSYAQKNEYPAVYCDGFIDDGTERKPIGINKGEGNIYKNILSGPGPMFQGLLVKMESLKKIGYLHTEIKTYQEWDTLIRLSKTYPIGFVAIPLFVWYTNNLDSISRDDIKGADGYGAIVSKYRDEILIYAGIAVLRMHYEEGAQKYLKTHRRREALENIKTAISLSNTITALCITKIQYHCLRLFGVNPKYLSPGRYKIYFDRIRSANMQSKEKL